MSKNTVAELTIEEFRELIREVVTQTITEMLADPDIGLELREEIREDLQRSIQTVRSDGDTVAAEAVAAKLGLEWQVVRGQIYPKGSRGPGALGQSDRPACA